MTFDEYIQDVDRRRRLLAMFDLEPVQQTDDVILQFCRDALDEAPLDGGYVRISKPASIVNIDDDKPVGDTMAETVTHRQAPSIGRIVHYQRFGSPGGEHKAEPSPAVITAINDAETMRCQLFVMNPNGLYFNDTPYADEPTPGHWSWPPRV